MPRQRSATHRPTTTLSHYLRRSASDPFVIVTLTVPTDQYYGQSALVRGQTPSRSRLRLQLVNYHLRAVTYVPQNVEVTQLSLQRLSLQQYE